MLENIKDLKIKGGCYVNPTDLNDIFAQRFNVVYGRNGTYQIIPTPDVSGRLRRVL